MRSLTISIEGLRQMERHGGAHMMERAFDGFAALPPPDNCWDILGIKDRIGLTPELVQKYFRNRAREGHGAGEDMHRLVKARDEALEKIGG